MWSKLTLLLIILIATPSTPSALAQVLFQGQTIEEEHHETQGFFKYVVPNELEPHLLAPVLKNRGGALISVGTFRSLFDAGLGNFSSVFLLDIDENVTKFNQVNLRLIEKAQDRYEYLALILQKKVSKSTLKRVRDKKISESQFMTLLIKSPNVSTDSSSEDQLLLRKLLPNPIEAHQRGKIVSFLSLALTHALHTLSKDPAKWKKTFLGSDLAFQKIKKHIENKTIVAVNGSLTGTETMPSIASALEAAGERVSMVDISNALDYIFSPGVYSSPDQLILLYKNLKLLPQSRGSGLILTHTSAVRKWMYRFITIDQVLLLIEKYKSKPPGDLHHEIRNDKYSICSELLSRPR